MQVDIQARNFTLTNAIRSYVQRRLSFALNSRDMHIQRIMVRLSDINGPKGGEDKCCHIQVVLPKMADVVIKDIGSDLYAAIDKAVDRASINVNRRLSKQRDKKRSIYRSQAKLFPDHDTLTSVGC
jgi:putative sigma-54 modulation protein